MTEADWWAATESVRLTDWLFFDAAATSRKLRLFSVACCRSVEHLVRTPDLIALLRMVEAVADQQSTAEQLRVAWQTGWDRHITESGQPFDPRRALYAADHAYLLAAAEEYQQRDRAHYRQMDSEPAFPAVSWAVLNAVGTAHLRGPRPTRQAEACRHVHLLHDIFGPLPFRDVAIAPAWLTSDVMSLARGIYEEKAFDRMPILADALQDAGCDNEEILTHCRATQWEHVRGCWVIDLLLGKPWREEPPAAT
jgi:hypothetical protein